MIPYQEYKYGLDDEEGGKIGVGPCGVCGRLVECYVEWQVGIGIVPISSNFRPDNCSHRKCGDKFPSSITRMAGNPDYMKTELGKRFQHLLCAIETADENDDLTGSRMAWEYLIMLRMALGYSQ